MLKSLLNNFISYCLLCLFTSLLSIYFIHPASAEQSVEQELKKREREIEEIARDFESIMISKSIKSMYEGIKTDEIVGGGNAENIYRELILEEYAKEISKRDGFGLVKYISRDMKRGDTKYKNLMRAIDVKNSK